MSSVIICVDFRAVIGRVSNDGSLSLLFLGHSQVTSFRCMALPTFSLTVSMFYLVTIVGHVTIFDTIGSKFKYILIGG